MRGVAQKRVRRGDVAAGNERAYARRRDGCAAEQQRLAGVRGEAERRAKGLQFGNAGAGVDAEAKVLAFVDFANVGAFGQNLAGKLLGRERGERGVERQDEGRVDCGGGELLQLAGRAV